jgi:hypothetical protein
MQRACAILSFVACPHYFIKGAFLRKKKVSEHKMCVLIFSPNLSETFLILRRIQRDVMKKVCWSSCKVPVIIVRY